LQEKRENRFDISIGQASLTSDTMDILKSLGYVQ